MPQELPILMNGAMVRATLAGTKTQTRRAVKFGKLAGSYFEGGAAGVEFDGFRIPHDCGLAPARFSAEAVGGGAFLSEELLCPYGAPGELLWLRETFFAYGRWETRYSEKKKRNEWHFVDMTVECDRHYQYAADNPDVPLATRRGGALPGWYKRPAIFMPRAASRILLEIVSVRVARLNDCSEADARDEGSPGYEEGIDAPPPEGDCEWSYRASFERLWESINGVGAWAANPWVWAIEFKRVTP